MLNKVFLEQNFKSWDVSDIKRSITNEADSYLTFPVNNCVSWRCPLLTPAFTTDN